jgi:uncharacterized protein with FMN-binding domain
MTAWQLAVIGSMVLVCLYIGSTERQPSRVRAYLRRRAVRRDPSWSARWTQMEVVTGAKPRVR